MTEDIAKTLSLVGIDLTFEVVGLTPSFIIKGVPGFDLTKFYNGESTMYIPEVQNFEFYISTVDQKAKVIVKNLYFGMSDDTYTHRFKIDGRPVPDLTGWTKLTVNWVSMT